MDFTTDPLSATSLFTAATPAANYSAAANGYTPAATGSGWSSWITPTLSGLTGLAGAAANVYSSVTGGKPAAPGTTNYINAGTPAAPGGISKNVLLIGGLAVVGLIVAVIVFTSKRGK